MPEIEDQELDQEEEEQEERPGEEQPGTPAGDDEEEREDLEEEPETPDEEERPSRKERRAERARNFSDQVRDNFQQPRQQPGQAQQQPQQQYTPSQEREQERFYASQERFQDRLETDSDYISSSSRYSFMDEESDDFDADLTDSINKLYLETVGYDPNTGTVQNTNLRYRTYVKNYVENLERFAKERNARSQQNIAKQRGKGGIRPNGNSRKTLGELRPGDISKMSPEEFAKHESEIDKQINSLLK